MHFPHLVILPDVFDGRGTHGEAQWWILPTVVALGYQFTDGKAQNNGSSPDTGPKQWIVWMGWDLTFINMENDKKTNTFQEQDIRNTNHKYVKLLEIIHFLGCNYWALVWTTKSSVVSGTGWGRNKWYTHEWDTADCECSIWGSCSCWPS